MAVIIRAARIDDADAIAAVHVRTWQEAYRGVVPAAALAALDEDARALAWRTSIAAGAPCALVADDDGVVVGFASFGAARDADLAGDGELYAIYVTSSHWRAGVGHALLTAVEHDLVHIGAREPALWVLADNPRARTFYQRHGWRVDGAERIVTGSAATGLLEVRYRKRSLQARE